MRKKIEEGLKREKNLNAEHEEFKNKIASLNSEVQSNEQSARMQASEISKHKNLNDQLMEQLEAYQREKRRLSEEVENVNNQLLDTQGRLTDTERRVKASEADRQTLQDDLDDQKDIIQAETTRYQNLTQQLEKIKLENDRRLSEKDEEVDGQKLTHRRQLETLQSTLDENENKHKSELSALKKKMGAELESALMELEVYKKQKADADNNMKKLQLSNKELVDQLTEEQSNHELTKEHLNTAEKRGKIK